MWSNVEVSPNISRPHTPGKVEGGGEGRWLMHSEDLGETSTQVNRRDVGIPYPQLRG